MEQRVSRLLRALALVASIAFAVWVVTLAVRSRDWPVINDTSLQHYVSWCIADGAVPYSGVFDFQMPGTLLLHLTFVRTVGTGDVAWRVFDLGVLAIAAWLVVRALRPCGLVARIVGPSLYALWHLALGAWNTGQRDYLIGVLLLAAADRLLALVPEKRGSRAHVWSAAAAGAFAGAAVTIKPTALLFVVGVVVCCAAWGGRRAALASLAGSALAPVVCLAWLAASGALPGFVEIVREYLIALHPRMERASPRVFLRAWLNNSFVMPIVVAAIAGALVGTDRRTRVVLVLGVAFGFVHFVAQSKGWEYHFEPTALFLCVLAASALAPAAGDAPKRARVLRGAAALIAATCIARAVAAIAPRVEQNIVAPRRVEHVRTVVDATMADLRELVPPGRRVQVFDSGSYGIEALLRLGIRQPTRFTYDHPFFVADGHPYVEALRAELVHELRAAPPAALVVYDYDPRTGGNAHLARFPAFADLVASDYVVARDHGAWKVFVPRSR